MQLTIRPVAAVLAAGVAVLGLAGCEPPEPVTGTVTYLEYEPYESWTECGYRTGPNGFRHECWQEYEYECFYVEFEDETGHTNTDCADEHVWKDLVVGDTYTS